MINYRTYLNLDLWKALKYKGGTGMWAWLLHRLTGLAILFFVGFHVLAAFFNYAGVQGNTVLAVSKWILAAYETPGIQIVVLFSILYHALNGLRITIMDMWPGLMSFQKEIFWAEMALFIPLFLIPSVLMIINGI